MKLSVLYYILCLAACTAAPSDGVVKAVSDNCSAINKKVIVINTQLNGYKISCEDIKIGAE